MRKLPLFGLLLAFVLCCAMHARPRPQILPPFVQNMTRQGWTLVQDIGIFCDTVGLSSTCSTNCATAVTCPIPTVAGSVWMVFAHVGNNVTISSVSGGGGTWNLCPSSECHAYQSGCGGIDIDAAYNLTGSTGTQSFTMTLSGTPTGYFNFYFVEMLPPSGLKVSFDAAGAVADSCTTPCTGVALTLTGTDAIMQNAVPCTSAAGNGAWTPSPPYFTDNAQDGVALNTTSGSAPSFAQGGGGGDMNIAAIAFKTSNGNFAQPIYNPAWTINQWAVPLSGAVESCSPGCGALTVTSTGASHALLLVEASSDNGVYLSSLSDNKSQSWTVPTTCRGTNTTPNQSLSCAYVLSSASGVTTITPTLTGSSTTAAFGLWELSKAYGSIALDAIGATALGVPNSNYTYSSQALTISGQNDACVQASWDYGGAAGIQSYQQNPGIYNLGDNLFVGSANLFFGQSAIQLNANSGSSVFWIQAAFITDHNTVSGVCFD
jgi:hypothetical protein